MYELLYLSALLILHIFLTGLVKRRLKLHVDILSAVVPDVLILRLLTRGRKFCAFQLEVVEARKTRTKLI